MQEESKEQCAPSTRQLCVAVTLTALPMVTGDHSDRHRPLVSPLPHRTAISSSAPVPHWLCSQLSQDLLIRFAQSSVIGPPSHCLPLIGFAHSSVTGPLHQLC
ncbi:hypothetical protein ACOMHN_011024 [Nucella lapillus]